MANFKVKVTRDGGGWKFSGDSDKGGNVVVANDHAVVSTQALKTADRLRQQGLEVHTVGLSEFHKGDACGTCLSVLF